MGSPAKFSRKNYQMVGVCMNIAYIFLHNFIKMVTFFVILADWMRIPNTWISDNLENFDFTTKPSIFHMCVS
jgi:hypothetical protein